MYQQPGDKKHIQADSAFVSDESVMPVDSGQKGACRLNLKVLAGGSAVLLLILVSIGAPFLCPFDPYVQDLTQSLQPPDANHIAGTDRFGRDIFSRILIGGRYSIFSALLVLACSTFMGVVLGTVAAWREGVVDTIIMRITDIFLSFPGLVFALAVAGILHGGLGGAIVALIVTSWPRYARLVRSSVLSIKNENYYKAARLSGCSIRRMIIAHFLPNCGPSLLVVAIIDIGSIIMRLSALSFLGLSAHPPEPEWGLMMSESYHLLQIAPWTVIMPGLALFFSVIIFNLFGDILQDYYSISNLSASNHISSRFKTFFYARRNRMRRNAQRFR